LIGVTVHRPDDSVSRAVLYAFAPFGFSGGFAGSTSKLTYNGSALIVGANAEVTDGGSNEAGSFFSTSPVDITRFTSQFTFQFSAGSPRQTAWPSSSRVMVQRRSGCWGAAQAMDPITLAARAAFPTAWRSSSTYTAMRRRCRFHGALHWRRGP